MLYFLKRFGLLLAYGLSFREEIGSFDGGSPDLACIYGFWCWVKLYSVIRYVSWAYISGYVAADEMLFKYLEGLEDFIWKHHKLY